MKRTICFLTVLFLLGTGVPLREAERPTVAISDREGLERIAEDPDGDYVLKADVDMGNAPWTPIPFSGTLDGAGHIIANMSVMSPAADTHETFDGNLKQYDTALAGLFSTACGAEIRDLHILNAKLTIETDRDCFIGGIAGYAEGTLFSKCSVDVRESLTVSAVHIGVGGIAGFCEDCTFVDCRTAAELVLADTDPETLCEEFLGGVYASGYATVRNCDVFTRGYAEVYGYAHNGGAVGMFKLPRNSENTRCQMRDTRVDAEIRFFEITPHRRAYCKPFIGENNGQACRLTNNRELHFESVEYRTPTPCRPEICENPVYDEEITEPLCTEWGYTTYTCETCGYRYRDDYVPPRHRYSAEEEASTCTSEGIRTYTCILCKDSYTETIPPKGHTPGEWTASKEAKIGEAGEEELRCTVCGALLETRTIPALPPIAVTDVRLSETKLNMHTGDSETLIVTIDPEDATLPDVRFESSAPEIAAVDENGCITAIGPGTATVSVFSADGGASAFCCITVVEEWIDVEPSAAPTPQNTGSGWLRCG